MIERISGRLLEKTPTWCVIDCHGVGMGLHISLGTFQQLDGIGPGDAVALHTHLHVREDVLQLFGFAEAEEKRYFRLLTTVSGVGPRLALAVLSGVKPDDLRQAIAREDVSRLTHIPGVGKKTAQRLILELREKIDREAAMSETLPGSPLPAQREQYQEAALALLSLGYKDGEARRAIEKVAGAADGDLALEEVIKRALKEL